VRAKNLNDTLLAHRDSDRHIATLTERLIAATGSRSGNRTRHPVRQRGSRAPRPPAQPHLVTLAQKASEM